jgi:hypothetical protein
MAHMHECPNCGERWECGEANYQDECPYPTRVLCLKCWSRSAPTSRGVYKAAWQRAAQIFRQGFDSLRQYSFDARNQEA